jgi:regulator of cell morphogenesis and NO signaling
MVSRNIKKINPDWSVSEIVNADYRTAEIFRKYGIEFCCGGKWPLKTVCELKNLDINTVNSELERSIRTISLPSSLDFEGWNINFLTDYIINVHHSYLKNSLPSTKDQLARFVEGHQHKFPYPPRSFKNIHRIIQRGSTSSRTGRDHYFSIYQANFPCLS